MREATVEVVIGGGVLFGIVVAVLLVTRKRPGRRNDSKPLTSGEAMRDDWGRR
jgi:hypothetical protein